MSQNGATLLQRLAPSSARFHEALAGVSDRLRVAMPGIIDEDLDSTKQTVRVRIAITENVLIQGQLSIETIPLLVDVPILVPRAGGYSLTLPVKKGDECLVVFGDCCIDAWWQSGGIQNQVEERRHDLSDGFAIVGVWNQTRVLSNYSTTSAQLRSDDGTVKVDLAADTITLTAPTVNVNATTATVAATGTATVQGDTVHVTGSTTVTIAGNNTTHIDGHHFLNHVHSGVTAGGSSSGPVV